MRVYEGSYRTAIETDPHTLLVSEIAEVECGPRLLPDHAGHAAPQLTVPHGRERGPAGKASGAATVACAVGEHGRVEAVAAPEFIVGFGKLYLSHSPRKMVYSTHHF